MNCLWTFSVPDICCFYHTIHSWPLVRSIFFVNWYYVDKAVPPNSIETNLPLLRAPLSYPTLPYPTQSYLYTPYPDTAHPDQQPMIYTVYQIIWGVIWAEDITPQLQKTESIRTGTVLLHPNVVLQYLINNHYQLIDISLHYPTIILSSHLVHFVPSRYLFNDSVFRPVGNDVICSRAAYVLFYQKVLYSI